LLIVLLLVGLVLVPPVKAQQYPSNANVDVNRDSVTVKLGLNLLENLTSLPALSAVLDSSNSSQLAQSMTLSMQKLVPGVTVSALTMSATTTLVDATQKLWLLQENYAFTVQGANTNLGSSIKADLAFLSMNDLDPFKLGTVEINNVGSSYLLQPLVNLPTNPNSRFFVNGREFLNKVNPDLVTGKFSLLDLSWIPPLSGWTQQTGPLDSSTVYTVRPDPPYNLTIGLFSIENVFFPIYLAIVDPSLTLTVAAGNAVVQGTKLSFDLPAALEIITPILIIGLLATLAATLLLDRRLTKTQGRRKKR
jgi:hypothetical protein